MSVKLLAEKHLEFLSLKGAAQARLSLHLSKCHIVGNHMSLLIPKFMIRDRSLDYPLILYLQVFSTGTLYKQFGPKSSPIKRQT